jgi:DNA-binding NarL/FixJ family response regulator
MLTTSDRPAEVEACYEAGCSFYIKKQVDYARFIASIKVVAAFVMECELPLYGETTHG